MRSDHPNAKPFFPIEADKLVARETATAGQIV